MNYDAGRSSDQDRESFEQEWNVFVQMQKQSANERRLKRLEKDLIGEKKMFQVALWPIFQSFDGFTLEYELKSISGVYIYVDTFYHPVKLGFECEGFVPHAENISRDRFSFERMRIRTLAWYGYKYVPFSWDELNKHPKRCQRNVSELLGRYSSSDDRAIQELTVFEREIIRYALRLNRPFRMADICYCLGMKEDSCRNVLKKLMGKELIRPLGKGRQKIRHYVLDERVKMYIL